MRFADRPHLCRTLEPASCRFFFIQFDSAPRPCVAYNQTSKQGITRARCRAGSHAECRLLNDSRPPWKQVQAGTQARLALRRQRRLLRRSLVQKLGQPCSSSVAVDAGDSHSADCEDWCSSNPNGTLAACKYCKCRACRACYTSALPRWATATLKGVRAACDLFGAGICNATGNLSHVIRKVEAESYARWAFNHTSQWIDALFASK